MTILKKVLVAAPLAAVGALATLAVVRRRRNARAVAGGRSAGGRSAGSMFVGAIDEVELSGPTSASSNPEQFDPADVPSEHQEINDLRGKMPLK